MTYYLVKTPYNHVKMAYYLMCTLYCLVNTIYFIYLLRHTISEKWFFGKQQPFSHVNNILSLEKQHISWKEHYSSFYNVKMTYYIAKRHIVSYFYYSKHNCRLLHGKPCVTIINRALKPLKVSITPLNCVVRMR